MAGQMNETDALQTLGISDFAHMTSDKVMPFAASVYPNMNPQAAQNALEQFQDFAHISIDAINQFTTVATKGIESSSDSCKRCLTICEEIISALKECMSKNEMSFEEKKYYIEKMMEIAQIAAAKDTENRKSNDKIINLFVGCGKLLVGCGVVLLAVALDGTFPGVGEKLREAGRNIGINV